MDHYRNFPDAAITGAGVIANEFLKSGVTV